jgi:GTP-binding protein
LVSKTQGPCTEYSIAKLQDRGKFFVDPGEEIYAGMIIGEQNKPGDLVVNIVEAKQLNNMRAAGKDKDGNIAPKILFSLEECMEYIQADECIEVTPNFIRMRKKILSEEDRKRAERNAK